MFKRIANLFKGFLGLFVSGLEKANPEALLEVEKENLRKQIANYNQGLASHAGLCERLMSQVKKLETEERELRAKAAAHLKAGNRDAAGQYALQLQSTTTQLAENREQLEAAEKTYQDLIKARDVAIKAAQSKIESLKYALTDLKIKRAAAEMNEMASGMIGSIGGSGDTLNRLHDMVEEERQNASGRARVARDSIDMSEVRVKDEEQKALAAQALADFAAKEGIALEIESLLPLWLTPGAAEALTLKIYRTVHAGGEPLDQALLGALTTYQPPVARAVLEFQIGLAVAESSDSSFVSEAFRKVGQGPGPRT